MAVTKKTPVQSGAAALGQDTTGQSQATINTPAAGLGGYKTAAASGVGTSAAGGGSRIPTYTAEYMSPDITTTRYITNQIFQSLIGRNATDAEINQYHQQFMEYAKTHPVFTRSATYSTDTGALLPSRDITAQKTPLSETDFINNLVSNTADAKTYRAATGYLDSMMAINDKFRGAYSG